jgi:hypothetical protein
MCRPDASSSPQHEAHEANVCRFTPTCVGNTKYLTRKKRLYTVHPHVRGGIRCQRRTPDGFNAQTTSAALSKAYTRCCEKNGERALSATSLGMRLKERGLVQQRIGHKKVRTWMNIELIQEDSLL